MLRLLCFGGAVVMLASAGWSNRSVRRIRTIALERLFRLHRSCLYFSGLAPDVDDAAATCRDVVEGRAED